MSESRVLILGLGESGLAMARWCARSGQDIVVWDSRETPPHAATLAADVPGARLIGGALAAAALDGVARVLKSPGLAPHDARIAPLLELARAEGVPVLGELDLFARALAQLREERGYAPQVLAITGTNGKTTTTAMTALLVECAGRSVAMAGNIGPTMLDTLAARWDDLPQVWVLELSSFQLDGVQGFEPAAAAVLNVTQDHLDWHGSMAAYAAAKARIFGSTAVRVINRDDAAVEAMAAAPEPVVTKDGAKPKATAKNRARPVPHEVLRFGLDAPRHPGDFGLVVENGMAWLVRALPADPTLRRAKGEEEEIHLQRLMPADALRV
ncbi:MAG: UDP-N-acetylmuramoyl-L-alanine--D-glutamate ligase, partial [Burkholderiales bacterium]|nr:UDP-N-acetylmuramoyl-L-alanine--D-glutamate ligase [Burkholderiales bacterium]